MKALLKQVETIYCVIVMLKLSAMTSDSRWFWYTTKYIFWTSSPFNIPSQQDFFHLAVVTDSGQSPGDEIDFIALTQQMYFAILAVMPHTW